MQQRYIIGAVYEKDAKTPKESGINRVGRTGTIAYLQINAPLWFEYDCAGLIGQTMRTSWVEKIEETDAGVWVYTNYSVYRLDCI